MFPCIIFAQGRLLLEIWDFSIAAAVMEIVPVDEEAEYSRLKCDPAISTADLEKALEQYFIQIGHRNLQEVLDIIIEAKCTWRTAPKARVYSYMSLGLTIYICGL